MSPPVSCMCLTYGRPELLEEAIQSFLLQDYEGEKELVVLNDLAEQTLIYNHPQVKVINIPKRFKTVGEKRNACAALCSHDVLAVWDDDDLYLPHRLSFSVKMKEDKRYFKPTKAFVLFYDKKVDGPAKNWFTSGGMWDRSLFNEVRGYAHMGSGQDAEIELKFKDLLGPDMNYENIKKEEIYYIYRWKGNSYHLSNFGPDKEKDLTGNEKVETFVKIKIRTKQLKTGLIELNPKWRLDYSLLVKNHIDWINSHRRGRYGCK